MDQQALWRLMAAAGPRGPRVRYARSNINTGSTVQVSSIAGNVSAGDLLLGIAASKDGGSGTTWTPPTGFTERYEQGAIPSLNLCSKTADGLEGSTQFLPAASDWHRATILVIRRGQYGLIGGVATRAGPGTVIAPGITMPSSGLLLGILALDRAGYDVMSSDDGMTPESLEDGLAYPGIGVFSERVSAGPTGDRSFTFTGITEFAAAVLVGITKP